MQKMQLTVPSGDQEAEGEKQASRKAHSARDQTVCTDVTFTTETVSPEVVFTEQAKLLQKSRCPRHRRLSSTIHYLTLIDRGPQISLILRKHNESLTQ